MPTLLDDRIFQPVDETLIAEFDLEQLARISEAPPTLEAPSFAQLQPARRFRRTLALAFLATLIVAGLATLGPGAQRSVTVPNACSVAH